MRLIGITGGVGMGKSTSQEILTAKSIRVIDTDELARALVEPGQPALAEIQSEFGPEVIAADGTLKRELVAQRVFGDDAARKRLESILHPRIQDRWSKIVATWRRDELVCGAVVIPLLFETGESDSFDDVVCVACSLELQHERLQLRGWSDEEIDRRIAAQWPIEEKMGLSDYVIWTDGDLQSHEEQWGRVLLSME